MSYEHEMGWRVAAQRDNEKNEWDYLYNLEV